MKKDKLGMLLYRYNENEDLEILMVNKGEELSLPESDFSSFREFEEGTGLKTTGTEDVIELENEEDKKGLLGQALAMEGKLENKMRNFMRIRSEEGNYVAMKEAIRKVLPHQYTLLKELKDILAERDLIKFL